MKNAIISIFCFALTLPGMSQSLSKKDLKELKQEIKSLKKDPYKFKQLKDNSGIKDIVINEQIYEIGSLNKELENSQRKLAETTTKLATAQAQDKSTDDCSINASGKNFRVQIGLYKHLDLTTYLNAIKFLEY